jgi:hypothetical protein
MATASLWIAVASILATFDIRKAVDEKGLPIEPSYEYDSGFIKSVPFTLRRICLTLIPSAHRCRSNVALCRDHQPKL